MSAPRLPCWIKARLAILHRIRNRFERSNFFSKIAPAFPSELRASRFACCARHHVSPAVKAACKPLQGAGDQQAGRRPRRSAAKQRETEATQTGEPVASARARCLKTSRRHRAGGRDKGCSDSDPTVHANSQRDSRSSGRRFDRGRNSRLDMVRIRAGDMRHPAPDISPGRIRRPLRQDLTA